MKKIFFIAIFLISLVSFSQEKGTIKGILTDKEMNNEPLPFGSVLIKGTTIGANTDLDGTYSLLVPAGEQTIIFSFLGYKTIEKKVILKTGQTLTMNQVLSAEEGVSLDEIQIISTISREKESALILEQKKAISIKTSIGAQELSKKGVSDVATAVTKVSGVSKQEGSNTVFVRGLGDRYNSTTLNGLPIPSNNPSLKNITLDVFSTDIVEVIDINKVYNSKIYGDFAGANINIESKEHSGKPALEFSVGAGLNANASNQNNFYLQDGPNFSGFYNSDYPINALNSYKFDTSWDRTTKTPINTSFSFTGGRSWNVGEEGKLSLFGTGSFSNAYKYKKGVSRGSVNAQGLAFTDFDFESHGFETNTTGMTNLVYKINENNSVKFNSLFINSSNQTLDDYNGVINIFDNAGNGGGFVRRATYDKTTFFVNQLLGEHTFTENFDLEWGIAFNTVSNTVPDRRQNTLVPINDNNPNGLKTVSDLATSDNHRFYQDLQEDEVAANIFTSYNFAKNSDGDFDGKVTFGYSGRFKKVAFEATQFNFSINRNSTQPIVDPNNLDAYFNQNSIDNNYFKIITFRGDASTPGALDPQTYGGNQYINAGLANVEYKISEKFSGFIGLRVEHIFQELSWKTSLDPNGDKNDFDQLEFLPNLSLKYALNEDQNLKFGFSKSYTLPQYKERAPFQFEEVTQIKFGNPDLNLSSNYNIDLSWELFPNRGEVISLTGFSKIIYDPINEVIVASATNDISYVNTGEKATVYGAELEIRKDLFSKEIEKNNNTLETKLSGGLNASYMQSNQKFSPQKVINETNLTVFFTNESGRLTGASDLLLNADVTFSKEFSSTADIQTTLAYNYFSDRVYAIGSSTKGDIVENGIGTLDLILKSNLSKNIQLGLAVKNILDPEIKRTQEIQNVTVSSFSKGINASFSLTYKLD